MAQEQKKFRLPSQIQMGCREPLFTKDALITNGFLQELGVRKSVRLRPALVKSTGSGGALSAVASGQARGLFYSEKSSILCVSAGSVANTVYFFSSGTLLATTTHPLTIGTFFEETGSNYIIFTDANAAYLFNTITNAVTTIAALGTGYFSRPVLFNGYNFFLIGNGRIINSGLNDPTTWNALSFVTATQRFDTPVTIFAHGNYIVALGARYLTVFYDAGIAAPASPLALYQSATQEIGCRFAESFGESSGNHFWVGRGSDGGVGVFCLPFGSLQAKRISNDAVDGLITNLVVNSDTSQTIPVVVGRCLDIAGHVLYLINFGGNTTAPTLVYDYTKDDWMIWKQQGKVNFPGLYSVRPGGQNFLTPGSLDRPALFLDAANGSIAYATFVQSYDTYDATNLPIEFEARFPQIDMETMDVKHMPETEFIGDTLTSGTASLSYSDDDYVTFSTSVPIDLTKARKNAKNLGQFNRRALKLTYSDTTSQVFRMDALEITVIKGTDS